MAQARFWTIFRCVAADRVTARATSSGSSSTRTRSAESMATLVPAPMATPRSASSNAGGVDYPVTDKGGASFGLQVAHDAGLVVDRVRSLGFRNLLSEACCDLMAGRDPHVVAPSDVLEEPIKRPRSPRPADDSQMDTQ